VSLFFDVLVLGSQVEKRNHNCIPMSKLMLHVRTNVVRDTELLLLILEALTLGQHLAVHRRHHATCFEQIGYLR
jgi:hypothetical protein